jgi:tripartite-type tricarboxylate transporter receptor subunit TctC
MRKPRTLLAFSICLAALASTAHAADPWPTKPIKLVVPYTPGGLTDVLARLIANKAGATLGQPIVVENKPGASTVIGAEYVAKSAPDGYTLLMPGTTTLTTNPIMMKKLPYKASDFAPVALVGMVPYIAVAHPSVPANNVQELVAYAKANPGKLTFSNSGQGSSSHLVGAMFATATGTKLTDIPYKGSAPALGAVLSGEVSLSFDGVTLYIPHIKAGKLKAIAVTGETRVPALDNVPTLVESGYKDAVAQAWFGIAAPSATPREVVVKINDAVQKAMREPDVVAKLREFNAYVEPRSAEAFGELLQREATLWTRVIAPLNLQVE